MLLHVNGKLTMEYHSVCRQFSLLTILKQADRYRLIGASGLNYGHQIITNIKVYYCVEK